MNYRTICVSFHRQKGKKIHLRWVTCLFVLCAVVEMFCNVNESLAQTGTSVNVVRSGDAGFAQGETWRNFSEYATINNASEVAFNGRMITNTSGNFGIPIVVVNTTVGLQEIVRDGDATPNMDGQFSNSNSFGTPVLTQDREVFLFSLLNGTAAGSVNDNRGIFGFPKIQPTYRVVRESQNAPDMNGVFDSMSNLPTANDLGLVAFSGAMRNTALGAADNFGIFSSDGNTILQVAREGFAAPGNGTFSNFGWNTGAPDAQVIADVNELGQVAFRADLINTTGGIADDVGIYRGNGLTSPSQIAREGAAINGTSETFGTFSSNVAINDSGQVAFQAFINTSGNPSQGIFLSDGTTATEIARRLDFVPEGNGRFLSFTDSSIEKVSVNNAGQVAFQAIVLSDGGTAIDDRGIYRGDGSTIVNIAREGDAVIGGNGTLGTFSRVMLNEAGVVGLTASLNGTSGGGADNEILLLGDGTDLIQVAREGTSLDGKTISGLRSFAGGNSSGSGRNGINDLGQMVYRASFTDGSSGVYVYTPGLDWRAADGNWNNSQNWTLGLAPDAPHNVTIATNSNVTITGPSTNTSVQSLSIGGGAGNVELVSQSALLTVTDILSIESSGTLSGDGNIAGNVDNGGRLSPGNSPGSIMIDGDLTQTANGELLFELAGVTPITEYDQLFVNGVAMLDGQVSLVLLAGFDPLAGSSFDVLLADSIVDNGFNFQLPTLTGNRKFQSQIVNVGNQEVLRFSVSVPEPSSTILMGSMLLLGLGRRIRQKKR